MTKTEQGPDFLLLPVCGLGDAIGYAPLVKAIRWKFPISRILVVVATQQAREIIQGSACGIETLVFNRSKRLSLKEKLEVLLILRNYRPAVVISGAHTDSFRVPLLAFFSGARARVGAEFERFSFLYNRVVHIEPGSNVVEKYRQLLSGIGVDVPADEFKPVLDPPPSAKEAAFRLWEQAGLDSYKMVIGITSGADTIVRGKWNPSLKRWNVQEYAQVAKWVTSNLGAGVVMFGTTAESGLGKVIAERCGTALVNFCGKTTLGELQWMLKSCRLLVCNDTGTMHLAAALGTPVVSLFGPTDPGVFAPPGRHHRVVQGQAPCSPCFPRPTCKLTSCLAMDAITPEKVIQSISDFLRGQDR